MLTGTTNTIFDVPGGVTPPVSSRPDTGTIDRQGFINLLVAQLQNQDPLNPTSNQEFTEQMTQFSSLDELIGINSGISKLSNTMNMLTGLDSALLGLQDSLSGLQELGNISQLLQGSLALQQSGLNASTISMIGKEVMAETTVIRIENGQPVAFEIPTPEGTEQVTLRIFDSNGNQVWRDVFDPSDPEALAFSGATSNGDGSTHYVWQGQVDGEQLADGYYQIEVKINNNGTQDIRLPVYLRGVVTGVDFTSVETLVELGAQRVTLGSIVRIRDMGQEG